ncbi:ankyrin repeat domain-containing protein [Synechococcus elongatus]|uniref:ankyrin repeat domain-containing protein n=2 Tax=Synechococcus elongatus TaxID=32046 RepID=UPI0030CBCFFD
MESLEEILQSCSDVLFPAEMGCRKVEIHSTDCDGDTPLHVMVRRADLPAVLALIEAGANVNAIGDMGETPLHIAVRQELEAIVKALLEAGANPDIKSEFGETPREQAAKLKGTIKRAFR